MIIMTPTKKNEFKSRVKATLSGMYNRTMHEDLYRIMDGLDDEALPNLVNLVGKIDKMCREVYRLTQENKRLKEKTQRIWR